MYPSQLLWWKCCQWFQLVMNSTYVYDKYQKVVIYESYKMDNVFLFKKWNLPFWVEPVLMPLQETILHVSFEFKKLKVKYWTTHIWQLFYMQTDLKSIFKAFHMTKLRGCILIVFHYSSWYWTLLHWKQASTILHVWKERVYYVFAETLTAFITVFRCEPPRNYLSFVTVIIPEAITSNVLMLKLENH